MANSWGSDIHSSMSLSTVQSSLVNQIADTICESFQLADDQREAAHTLIVERVSPLILQDWPSSKPAAKRSSVRNAYQLFLSHLSNQVREERAQAKETMSAEDFEKFVSPTEEKIQNAGGKLFNYAPGVWASIKNTPAAQQFHDEASRLRAAAGKQPVKTTCGSKRPKNAYNIFCMHYTAVRKGQVESEDKDHYLEVLEQCGGKIQAAQSVVWKEIKGTDAAARFVEQAAEEKATYEARAAATATASADA